MKEGMDVQLVFLFSSVCYAKVAIFTKSLAKAHDGNGISIVTILLTDLFPAICDFAGIMVYKI